MSRSTAVASSAFVDVDAEAHLESDLESTLESTLESKVVSEPAFDTEGYEARETVDDLDNDLDNVVDGDSTSAPRVMSAMSDEELLKGIQSQSEMHFAELYNRYFQRIYSFVYTRMRNHAETEEVVQETFLAVFRSFEHYRGQSSLLSWIYGIAKNTANNSIRRAKSQNERIELADEEDLIPRPSLGVGTPGDELDLHRFQDQLTVRLEGLADWQAEIFEMRHFENLSIPEISRRTTRSSDAVRSSLYRVKRIFLEAAQASGSSAMMIGERS